MSRRNDLLFHAGGECVEQYGTLIRKTLRDDDNGYTHTRTGAVGTSVGFDGVIRSAAANVPRVDWSAGDAYLLLEDARTNVVTDDDLSNWSLVRTPTVTGSQTDPAGGTGAYTIADSGSGDWEYAYHNVSFVGDGTTTVVCVVRENTMPASGVQDIRVLDSITGATRLRLYISGWVNGEPTVVASTGTFLGKRLVGNGYWALYGKATGVVVGNTNRVQIGPANSNSVSGSIDVYRVNAYSDNLPSFSVLNASEARADDTFYADFTHPPQEMTVYAKLFHGLGTLPPTTNVVARIGRGSAPGDTWLMLYYSSVTDRYEGQWDDGTTLKTAAGVLSTPSWGDAVELTLTLGATGSIQVRQSINGGSEVSNTASGTQDLPESWSDSVIYLGSADGGTQGMSPLRSVKVARGIKTMNEMRHL